MRTVRDAQGIHWICLEMPEIPEDQQAAAAGMQPPPVAIECNSGANRAIVLVSEGWDDALSDEALIESIQRSLR